MNSLNLRQIDGGNVIKQTDSGSLFKFELLDENHKKFEEQLGDTATVILKQGTVAVFKKIVAVTDNCVAFNLDKILEVGDYILEIIVGGYVFPSNNRLKISVESTYGDYQPENLVRITYEDIDEKINALTDRLEELNVAGQTEMMNRIVALEQKEDKDTVYDDTKIKNSIDSLKSTVEQNEVNVNQELLSIGQKQAKMNDRLVVLESRTDNDTIYDDTSIKQSISSVDTKVDNLSEKVKELEQRPSSEAYDDSELVSRVTALEQKEDHDTIYNDTEIKQSVADVDTKVDNLSAKVTSLEERPIVDTALTERVEALERKEDKDTVYDDSAIVKRIETLEQKQDKDTIYDDSNLKSQIVELESKLQSLNTVRRAPTGYTLDRTTTPWTVWFDNGCGLQMPEYGTTATVYGYGFSASFTDNSIATYPIIPNIIRASNGSLTIEKIKTIKGGADYWSPSIKIINPIRNRYDYDWTNARFNPEALSSNHYSSERQQYFIRTMYELGIWSKSDVEGLGATKK